MPGLAFSKQEPLTVSINQRPIQPKQVLFPTSKTHPSEIQSVVLCAISVISN